MTRPEATIGCKVIAVLLLAALAPAWATDAPAPLPTHRSLRDNQPHDQMPEPTEPHPFTGYDGAPAFKVVPRHDKLVFYPCSACHSVLPPNPEPRKLAAPHPAALQHGNGRIWCLDCHDTKDRDHLHTFAGSKVEFDDAYLVCGQCHFNRQKDWYFGAHGKRVGNWRGERVIYGCPECHDPHNPKLQPRAPGPPPPVRAGLAREPVEKAHE